MLVASKSLLNKILFILALILVLFSISSCAKKVEKKAPVAEDSFNQEDPLEVQTIAGNHYIAIAAPLTGPYKQLGNSIVEGANLAVEEFNLKEKSKNHKIGTLVIDDGGLVSEAFARADLVIAQQSLGVIGHLNSEISIEAAKKYARAGIVEISPASTSPKLTEIVETRGYVYRTIGTDTQLGQVAADYVKSNDKFVKVAVLYNDRPYGVSVSSEFVKELTKDTTKEIVLCQTIPVRTTDHESTALKVAEAKADLVFFIGEYNDAGYLLNALKKHLPEIQFLGSEGVHHQEFIKISQANSEGALIIGAAPPTRTIQDKYEARYKKPISGYVGTSYRATKLLLDAIKSTNYKNSKEVAKAIGSNTIFNHNGDLLQPDFVIYRVEAFKFVI